MLFKLVGTTSNRMAIGARVTVKTGKLVQFAGSASRRQLYLAK